MASTYEQLKAQPNRLGEFRLQGIESLSDLGEFGSGDGVAYINAVGNAVNGVVGSITRSQVLRQQSSDRRKIAITVAIENTKKLGISSKAATEQAAIGVESVVAQYGSITKLILGAGVVLSGLLIAAAFAYNLAAGDEGEYELEYEYR
jgi:hypothetical protein